MNRLLVLPILIPLSTATLCLLAHRRFALQRTLSIAGATGSFAASLAIFVQIWSRGPAATRLGDWPSPFAIILAVDLLSATLLVVTGFAAATVTIAWLAGAGPKREHFGHHVLVQTMLAGVAGAFLTADLFNLYVWFEIFLLASFVLLALDGSRRASSAGIKYAILNLLGSVLFLSAIGLLYGLTGSLNLAELARTLPAAGHPGLVAALASLLLVAFSIKAAAFPLFSWLPAAYPAAPPALLALFSGLLSKVGVYAILRVFTLAIPIETGFLRPLLLWAAGLTMITGVLGAVAQGEIRRLLSFHIVSQIGYLLFGAALASAAALGGAIFFFAHVIVAKCGLFLAGGVVERLRGTGELKRLGGLHRTDPGLSILFLVLALSLAGLPPLSGFWAKLFLLRAGLEARSYWLVATALGVSLLTLFSMMKIWAEAFWKDRPASHPEIASAPWPLSRRLALYLPVALCALSVAALGFFAGPVAEVALEAGRQLADPSAYIGAILGASR